MLKKLIGVNALWEMSMNSTCGIQRKKAVKCDQRVLRERNGISMLKSAKRRLFAKKKHANRVMLELTSIAPAYLTERLVSPSGPRGFGPGKMVIGSAFSNLN